MYQKQVQVFNEAPEDRGVLVGDKSIMFFSRKDPENREGYTVFDEQFEKYMQKLPEGPFKKYVNHIFRLEKIFLGSSLRRDNSFAYYFLTQDNRLAGVVLDFADLGLGLKGMAEGLSLTRLRNPADAAAAVYFCLLRAAVEIQRQHFRQDLKVHRLLVDYLYLLLLRFLGPQPLSQTERQALFFAAGFLFYCQYLQENPQYAVSLLKREYSSGQVTMDEALEEKLRQASITSVRELPGFLYHLGLLTRPDKKILTMARSALGRYGFYAVFASVEYLVAAVVVARYPVSFFPSKMLVKESLHRRLEEMMEAYLAKTPYDLTAVR